MFKLVRFVAVANAIALIGVVGILYELHREMAVDEMILTTQQHNATLARAIANAMSPIYEREAGLDGIRDAGSLPAIQSVETVDNAIRSLARGLPVIKVVIYDREEHIIYSSDDSEIGAVGADDWQGFASALGGTSRSEIEFRSGMESFDGAPRDRQVIETYTPFIGGDGTVFGVFELYTDVTDKMEEINGVSIRLLAGLSVVFVLLYAGLLAVIRHANRTIAGQYRDLEESRSHADAKSRELLAEIAHRNQVEAALRLAREEAEEASRTKSRFLANMSHELRTPLNAVIGFSEVIAEQVLGRVEPPRYREYASDIRESGRRLLSLVDDILDLTKVESGTAGLDIEQFGIAGAVHAAVRTVEMECRRNGNELMADCDNDLGDMLSDRSKFLSILTNIMGNAAKFTRHGRVNLRVRREGAGEWIIIEVSDTGIGMESGRVGDMFAEFTQHDSSISRTYGGSGLGLAITRRFCEMLGGEIAIESNVGEGTSVTVRLPANARGEETARAVAE